MASLLLLYNNYADEDGVSLSGGVWTVPLSNLLDPVPLTRARSFGLGTANTQFQVDLGAARSVRAPCVTHTNMTAAGQYKWTWYSDAWLTEVDNSGWAAIPGYPTYDPDALGASIFHVFSAAVSARYWKIEFDDAANPDGYVELGRLFMGDTWAPAFNFDESNSDELSPNTARQDAEGGTAYFVRRRPARAFSFAFPRLAASAEAPTIRKIRRIANLNRQVILIPDPADTANFFERCYLGRLSELPAIQLLGRASATDAAVGFRIVEAL